MMGVMKKLYFGAMAAVLVMGFAGRVDAADVVIKSTTNRGETDIGDYWIGEDFAKGFEANGQLAEVDYRGEYHKMREEEPVLSVYMQGYTKFVPPYGAEKRVLYVYYPMVFFEDSGKKAGADELNAREVMPRDSSLDDVWQNFDVIAVASPSYAKKLRDAGVEAHFVPQFTNPEKFFAAYDKEKAADILFVGSNWHDRTSLRYALESGFTVDVYGYNWDGVVPLAMYKGRYIPNDELFSYYASAKIVLNDHRPDMKEFGFVNNRIYDATAAGALVISDYMKEIEDAYGDTVVMYKDREDLKEKIAYYLAHDEERKEKAARAREITLARFTNKAVAQRVWELARDDASK